MFKLVEPQWGVKLLVSLFTSMQASPFRSHRIPILADGFVFTYPVYLLALYIFGIVQMTKRGNVEALKRGMYYKIASLYIFAGTFLSLLINVGAQFFFDKLRPNVVLGFADLKNLTPLNALMPTSSFPSDHATVTMAIAMMSLFRGIKNKDKKFLRFGGILILFSFVTSFARVSSGVHWPTDIIAGSTIGIIIPLLLMWKLIYRFGTGIAERIGKVV